MTQNGWVLFGAMLGAGAVTGLGLYLKVRELSTPEFQAQAQAEAQVAANNTLANTYGLTQQRLQQFSAIAARFGAH